MAYSTEVVARARARLAEAREDRESENRQHLAEAYERTCLNTGGMNWAYMNKILQRWHEAGYHSAKKVKEGDKRTPPKGGSGQLGQAELENIARVLKES